MTKKARVHTYEESGEMLFKAPMRRARDQRTLLVTWCEETSTLEFIVTTPSGDILPGGESKISNREATIQHLLAQIGDFIKETSGMAAHAGTARESQELVLAGYGKALFHLVVPDELRDEISKWPKGAWIMISTNEQWVPWELLHDKHGFLVDRFRVFRLPRVRRVPEESSGLAESEEKPTENSNSGDGNRIVHVIGGDLSAEVVRKSDAHFEKRDESLNLVRLKRKKVATVVQELANATLVHFTCHGHTDPLRLQVSDSDGQAFNLTITTMGMVEVKDGCTVFANACNSGVAELIFGEFNSFGWEFYRKGADAFIGTLGTVPIDNALEFAQLFYDSLFENNDVCMAFGAAIEGTEGPIRLLYCFLGNPLWLSLTKTL